MSKRKATAMAIVRWAPGEPCVIAGTYELVGHYGEPMDYSVRLDPGDQFPLAFGSAPLWYVLMDEAESVALAA